jgi:hypothetical protein
VLHGNVHPFARPENDQGALSDAAPMNRMLLLLQRSTEQEQALQQLFVLPVERFHAWCYMDVRTCPIAHNPVFAVAAAFAQVN